MLKRPRAGGKFIIKEQGPKHRVILLLLIQWCIPVKVLWLVIPLAPLLSPSECMCLKLEKDRENRDLEEISYTCEFVVYQLHFEKGT